ncbi:hypothetical protein ACFQMM_22520 [Saliphagus sp. GCM10025308]
MSDNTIKAIENILEQQNNNLTEDEINFICNRIRLKAHPSKFRWAVVDALTSPAMHLD